MAVLDISFTVEDGVPARIRAAMKETFGQVEDPPGSGTFRDMTNLEASNRFKAEIRDWIKQVVKRSEKRVALAAAQVLDPDVDIT